MKEKKEEKAENQRGETENRVVRVLQSETK